MSPQADRINAQRREQERILTALLRRVPVIDERQAGVTVLLSWRQAARIADGEPVEKVLRKRARADWQARWEACEARRKGA